MRSFLCVLCLLVCSSASAQGPVAIELVNTMPEPIEIWSTQVRGQWDEPVFLGRGQRAVFVLTQPGKHYMTIRDSLNRDLVMGWVDLHEWSRKERAIGILALYQAQGWLTGYEWRDGKWIPTWRPLSTEYVMRAMLCPYRNECTRYFRELQFVNRPDEQFSELITEMY